MKIYDIMNQIAIIEEDITLHEAANIMTKEKIGSLVFSTRNKPKGIITESDIVKHVDNTEILVSEVMAKNLVTIEMDETLEDAAGVMAKHGIKRLIVMDGRKLVGIITSTDILENADLLNRNMELFG